MAAHECLELMEHLAYAMHSNPAGKQVIITAYDAARVLSPWFRNVPDPERRLAAARLLRAGALSQAAIARELGVSE